MPSGDAQRIWFPAMLEDLTGFWQTARSVESLIPFCAQMTEFRDFIRHCKGIKPIKMYCPHCQARHEMELPPVSIRSALFALKKTGTIEEDEFNELDRLWGKYRRKNDLDAYGNPKPSTSNDPHTCQTDG